MATRISPWLWISLLAGGVLAGALGVIFIVLGLEQADQLASVVGVFVALAGLGISVYGVVLSRRGDVPSTGSSSAAAPPLGAGTITASGQRSVAVRDNSGVIQTGNARAHHLCRSRRHQEHDQRRHLPRACHDGPGHHRPACAPVVATSCLARRMLHGSP